LRGKGVATQSIWDAILTGAGELLMRQPGIVTLHSVTSSNAMRYAYQTSGNEELRRMLLLQNASFVPLFRGAIDASRLGKVQIDKLEPVALKASGSEAVDEIFTDIGQDRMTAAAKTLAYLAEHPEATELMTAARRLIFLKGTDSHDYKFSAAVLEDYARVSPQWRARFLASSMFYLKGSAARDNGLVQRTREALKSQA
jgi:hypothetical protein